MKLNLTTLEERRLRGDLIQIYKIIHGFVDINLIKGLRYRDNNYQLRGNSLRLNRELVKGCTPRFNFLTNRIVNEWNALPEEIVRAKNLNSFKAKIDEWLKRKLL